MNTVNTATLANLIWQVYGFPASCVLKEEESQIIIRVFQVPEDRKDSLENAIYDLESTLVPHKEVFFSVIAYTSEETNHHYPDMARPKPAPAYEAGLTYRNETPFTNDMDDKARMSKAA